VGIVLSAAGQYTPEAFRVAWTVQYVVWALTLLAVLVTRREARRMLAAEGVVVRPLREVLAERRAARRS
jgi:hypothetical protein